MQVDAIGSDLDRFLVTEEIGRGGDSRLRSLGLDLVDTCRYSGGVGDGWH